MSTKEVNATLRRNNDVVIVLNYGPLAKSSLVNVVSVGQTIDKLVVKRGGTTPFL